MATVTKRVRGRVQSAAESKFASKPSLLAGALAVTGLFACGGDGGDAGTMDPGSITGAAGGPAAMGPVGPQPSAGSMAGATSTARPAGAGAPSSGNGMGMPAAGSGASSPVAGGGAPATPDPGAAGAAAPSGTTMPGPTTPAAGDPPPYHDPGSGPWEMGTPEECKMDTSLIGGAQNMAVFRYGKLCHIQGGNTSGQNWSATKTLGGVLAGRAAYLVKDVARSGPGTGPILHEDKATDWLGSVSYNNEALLSHVMAMVAHNGNLAYGSKSFSYDTVGEVQISSIVDVSMVALEQLGGSVPTEEVAFMNQEVFERLGMTESSWPGSTIGYGWTGTLEDMGRVAVMLVHDGWYGDDRFMEASWVYRMSHPSHEDANTAYGQLAWLNNRGGGTSFGAAIDTCAPAAFWPSYPHVGSEAPDCGAMGGSCEQEHDVGVFSAQGLGGQFLVMHPGLDLVITAHNASGPPQLWADIRPALVAKDPMFMGDEAAFCEAYGAGSYAPDLLAPRVAPMP
jgi:hypothetical protein